MTTSPQSILPAEVHETLAAYAKERGLDPAELFNLAFEWGYIKNALNDWSEKVTALVNDPDLIRLADG
jgi:hypothetical protein